MYRKDAARHIVRDVRKRLTEMRRKVAWTDWRMALIASQSANPDWFRHGETAESLEALLREDQLIAAGKAAASRRLHAFCSEGSTRRS